MLLFRMFQLLVQVRNLLVQLDESMSASNEYN